MSNKLLLESLAEFLGTFKLVFIGALAVAVTSIPDTNANVVIPALAHGLAVIGIIYVYGHISGAHVNPAVTAGLVAAGKMSLNKALFYWAAQLIGGIVAAAALVLILPDPGNYGQTKGILTDTNIGAAAIFEAILTFFLVSAVVQAAVYGRAGNLAALAIGFTLIAAILAGGIFTGASLNPARTLGPALMAGDLGYVIPYFIGTIGGGVIAGALHSRVLAPE